MTQQFYHPTHPPAFFAWQLSRRQVLHVCAFFAAQNRTAKGEGGSGMQNRAVVRVFFPNGLFKTASIDNSVTTAELCRCIYYAHHTHSAQFFFKKTQKLKTRNILRYVHTHTQDDRKEDGDRAI